MSQARVRRLLRAVAPVAAVVTAGVLARADAPPGQYDPFDRSALVITDARTGLVWQRDVTAFTNFQGALGYCSALSLAPTGPGWRLPSYKELLTLVDESPHIEYPTGAHAVAIDANAFPGTPLSQQPDYWTSSPDPNVPNKVFQVDFEDGTSLSEYESNSGYVRCVHDP